MNAKHQRNLDNQAAESRLLDQSELEQRALQIARDEGRDQIEPEDRARSESELLAPNETEAEAPEITPELGPEITAWDEVPGQSGTQAHRVTPDDELSIGKELVEKGLRGPRAPYRPEND